MKPQAAGFTLLEVLAALVVLSFILVGLAQGVHFGLLAWGTEARQSTRNDNLNTLDTTLRHVIEGADPGDALDPAPFVGSHDRLACLTALPDAAGAMRHRRIQALLMVDAQHRLVLRWRPFTHATRLKPAPSPIDSELLQGVSGIDLAYWRPGGGWLSSWSASDLPVLVRIHVQFQPGDPRRWPDIVAAPRLDRP